MESQLSGRSLITGSDLSSGEEQCGPRRKKRIRKKVKIWRGGCGHDRGRGVKARKKGVEGEEIWGEKMYRLRISGRIARGKSSAGIALRIQSWDSDSSHQVFRSLPLLT